MKEWILTIYIFIVICMFFGTIKDYESWSITPKQIYEISNLNMFACVILSVIMVVFNPILAVVRFFHWIFHVGRMD